MEPKLVEPELVEQVELELRLLQDHERDDRPDAVELEPQLMVDELDQVAHGRKEFPPTPHTTPYSPRQRPASCGPSVV